MKTKIKRKRVILFTAAGAVLILFLVLFLSKSGEMPVSGRFQDISAQAVPEMQHFDPSEFYTMYEEAAKLAADGNQQESFARYDDLLTQLNELYTQKALAMTAYSENVTDAGLEAENEYADTLYSELFNKMLETGGLLANAFGDSFREYLGNDWLYNRYVACGSIPDGVDELNQRKAELVSDYFSVVSNKDSYTYTFNGKEYCMSDLYEVETFEGMSAAEANEIIEGCEKAYNAAAGEIYLELVQLRTELASLYGYDSFADYADDYEFFRDYSEEELQLFYEGVKSVAYRYQPIYSVSEFLPYSGETIDDTAWLASKLVKNLSQREQDCFETLIDNSLLVAGSGDCYADGGYSDALPSEGLALIYMKYYGDSDITTLMHELGHFTEFITNGYDIMDRQVIDVSEIHSTGTEALLMDCFDEVFPRENAAKLKAYELNQLMSCVVTGCIFDEWQRMVYRDPDMTLDEINEAYRQVCLSYGRSDTPWLEYEWIGVHHNYENPMYYISYATSAIVSMQIYELGKTDRQTALDTWDYFLDCGSGMPYMEAVQGSGLHPFTDSEFTVEVFNACADEYDAIVEKYRK